LDVVAGANSALYGKAAATDFRCADFFNISLFLILAPVRDWKHVEIFEDINEGILPKVLNS